MNKKVIKIENLAKEYKILHSNKDPYSRFSDAIVIFVKKLIMPWRFFNSKNVEMFKALDGINLEIKKGEKIAIIGRNGAGKSTLLKVLSRITEPTTGSVKIKGRVASLLEVGTGFHPELTGRENIFLNGAVLGMTKKEIQGKFDDIVEFSGCEKFLDTPVKRYSSGMRVRLGFAVAAHLESEILIVDEVLAVGDAEFQKKCLGKMDEIAKGEGRTIIFVSHNMSAVQNLCDRGVVLDNGKIKFDGDIKESISRYMSYSKISGNYKIEYPEEKYIEFIDVCYRDIELNKINSINVNQEIYMDFELKLNKYFTGLAIGVPVRGAYGSYDVIYADRTLNIDKSLEGQNFIVRFKVFNQLSPGDYSVDFNVKRGSSFALWVKEIPYIVNNLNEKKKNYKIQSGVYQGISDAEIIKKEEDKK